jgi:hypothetical protein
LQSIERRTHEPRFFRNRIDKVFFALDTSRDVFDESSRPVDDHHQARERRRYRLVTSVERPEFCAVVNRTSDDRSTRFRRPNRRSYAYDNATRRTQHRFVTAPT